QRVTRSIHRRVFRSFLTLRTNVQSYENALLVGKVTENLFYGFRKAPHQGRQGNDLVTGSKLRLLDEIDHLDRILPLHVLLTDTLKVVDGPQRLVRVAGNVEAKV